MRSSPVSPPRPSRRSRSESGLAARAPIGDPVCVTLAAAAHRRPATGTRPAGSSVDLPRHPGGLETAAHLFLGRANDPRKLIVPRVCELAPWAHPGGEAGFALVDVPDAGQYGLVQKCVPKLPCLIRPAQHRDRGPDVEVVAEEVRPERGDSPIHERVATSREREGGPSELNDVEVVGREDEPGRWLWAAPAGTSPVYVPGPLHPEMAMEDPVPFEAEQQMLSTCLGGEQPLALQHADRAGEIRPWAWAPNLTDGTSQERGPDSSGRSMYGISLGHHLILPDRHRVAQVFRPFGAKNLRQGAVRIAPRV